MSRTIEPASVLNDFVSGNERAGDMPRAELVPGRVSTITADPPEMYRASASIFRKRQTRAGRGRPPSTGGPTLLSRFMFEVQRRLGLALQNEVDEAFCSLAMAASGSRG